MQKYLPHIPIILIILLLSSCSKSNNDNNNPGPIPFSFSKGQINNITVSNGQSKNGISFTPVIKLSFSLPLDQASAANYVKLSTANGATIACTQTFENQDSTVVLSPNAPLSPLSKYVVSATTTLQSKYKGFLSNAVLINVITNIDSSDKFPRISDDALLDLVQQQTFKYFWDYGHPVSGMARERSNGDDNTVTTGGTGFGIMAIVAMVERGFISRADGLARLQKIIGYLKTADSFHGAFPHWLNGTTGKVIPFSNNDNGADLVETSFLMQGLLTARQYFNQSTTDETTLRTDINTLWNRVEWTWFQNGTKSLFWHWSPDKGWVMNLPITGWNESLIVYVLAASSTTYPIGKDVYDQGWAKNGGMKNGNNYYGYQLPLGEPYGGPLFFAHYSFLGINPNNLKDTYADNYFIQNKNHTLINYTYCKNNVKNYFGYSDACWGLTASDIPNGYTASSPTNDQGVIAPTAAISSLPYTPEESMRALRFFYYTIGDKLWGNYGFKDAFSLNDIWFANSFLAIDQGPQIVMIENYRSRLLWNLFMSCPEVRTGLTNLGFSGF